MPRPIIPYEIESKQNADPRTVIRFRQRLRLDELREVLGSIPTFMPNRVANVYWFVQHHEHIGGSRRMKLDCITVRGHITSIDVLPFEAYAHGSKPYFERLYFDDPITTRFEFSQEAFPKEMRYPYRYYSFFNRLRSEIHRNIR